MYIKSPYPAIPPLPPSNFHSWLFDQPPGNQIPKDHIQHVDALTGETRTYAEFLERVFDATTALSASVSDGGLGVKPDSNEVIGIFSPNCLDYIVLVHSCLRLTIPFGLLPAHPTASELKYLLNKLRATRLFVHPSLLSQAQQVSKEIRFPFERIYILDGHDGSQKDFDGLINNVRKKSLTRQPVVPAKKDTLAYLLFSSGTSGPPKAVMISHGNLCFSIVQLLVYVQETMKVLPPEQPGPPPRSLCFLPFYHTFGLHFFMFRTFVTPITLFILPRWNLDATLEYIPKYKITHLALVPSIIHQLVYSPKTEKADLSSLVFAGSGAAYLPPALAQKMGRLVNGPKGAEDVPEGYGLSEATVSSISRPVPGMLGGLKLIPGSTGILQPGQEARTVREDGSEAGVNEIGELWLKGGNVALGYWDDEEATKETFGEGGWLRTGDRFRIDENGTFFYEDRMKDTLKISGTQVSPAEIEEALITHPDKLITDAAVAGIPGGRTQDEKVPRAWVVLSEEGQKHGEAGVRKKLNAWVEEKLSRFKWLKGGISFIDEIPKSPTGKVLRRVLQEKHAKESHSSKAKL